MTKKVTREDWLDAALDALAQHGPAALRAQSLAKMLGVTRGSFYHHFDDVSAFEQAVLDQWRGRSASDVADNLSALPPRDRIAQVLRLALRSPGGVERAVRAWAAAHDGAAKTVAKVDAIRLDFARGALADLNIPEPHREARATMLHLAAIGSLMQGGTALGDDALDALCDLITARP